MKTKGKGNYGVPAGFTHTICGGNPIIMKEFPTICRYYRVFPADSAGKICRFPVISYANSFHGEKFCTVEWYMMGYSLYFSYFLCKNVFLLDFKNWD